MRRKHADSTVALPVKTRLGVFVALFTAHGLSRLLFPPHRSKVQPNLHPATTTTRTKIPRTIRKWHRITTNALNCALAGRKPRYLPRFDFSGATHFQQRVWTVLQMIPPGTTCTYGQVAHALGKPQAARAVGNACKANPIPVLIPCHRVLAAGGRLGGFSAGLSWKQALLACEKR